MSDLDSKQGLIPQSLQQVATREPEVSGKLDYQVSKFNGENWPVWKWQISTILKAKSLLDVLDSNEPKGSRRELKTR